MFFPVPFLLGAIMPNCDRVSLLVPQNFEFESLEIFCADNSNGNAKFEKMAGCCDSVRESVGHGVSATKPWPKTVFLAGHSPQCVPDM
jgi:hypothetical protein